MEAIRGFYENYIRWSAASMTLSDVLEIAIFTYFIYHIILWIKQSKAWILLKGAAAIFAMYILAVILQLNNIVMVFNRIAPYVATALLVIFQPEIRRALEQLGTNHLFELFSLSSTKDKVAGFINCTYLADDAEFDTSENIADNKKEFYEISLIENYRPFTFLDDAEKRTEY